MRVEVADGRITDCQLYEPFQGMYNEMLAKINVKEDKELADSCERVCISLPTAVSCSENIELSEPSGDGRQLRQASADG